MLARFLTRSRFAWLAEGTREAYAKDYRLFFSFFWQRGKYRHEADPDDLLDWGVLAAPRPGTGPGISGSKWQREVNAPELRRIASGAYSVDPAPGAAVLSVTRCSLRCAPA